MLMLNDSTDDNESEIATVDSDAVSLNEAVLWILVINLDTLRLSLSVWRC